VAAKKPIEIPNDNLALNKQQISGMLVDHELLMVWAVYKSSLHNKLILTISAFTP
jgi:predicted DNA repair protein MutK